MNIGGEHGILRLGARIALGAIFVYAGALKLGQPLEFARNIAAYEILPYFGNVLLAVTLPWVECLCGLLLIAGWRVRASSAVITLLLLVFLGALVSAQVRGLSGDCGCFEVGQTADPPPLWVAIVRDLGLLGLALSAWLSASPQRSKRSQ